jgi:hypothetical protein
MVRMVAWCMRRFQPACRPETPPAATQTRIVKPAPATSTLRDVAPPRGSTFALAARDASVGRVTADWSFRRGFWRLALLVWAAGAIVLVWLPDEPLLSPRTNVCAADEAHAYAECRIESDAPPRRAVDRLLDYFVAEPVPVDETRVVPRWTTTRYRAALRALGIRELGWALVVWVPFYLLVWAFAGFQPSPRTR